MDNLYLIPSCLISDYQNLEINNLSWSEINFSGRLYSDIIYFKNLYTKLSAVAYSIKDIKYISLVSLSTTTIIESNLKLVIDFFNRESFIIKSIETLLYTLINI